MSSSGRVCLFWANHTDHEVVENGYFPDETLEDAANYCRSPDNDIVGPWCYVDVDGNTLWDHCDVALCNGNESIILNID